MKVYLNLNDGATKQVMRKYGLTPGNRLGRGKFCAAYDAGWDEVMKLTSDSIQLESIRDYFKGKHFPQLIQNYGYMGEQRNEASLFLFKVDRLKPVKDADAATKTLARSLVRRTNKLYGTVKVDEKHRWNNFYTERDKLIVQSLIDDERLPTSLREAFEPVLSMLMDYDGLRLDLYGANLMVRGQDELILNDIVVDGKLISKLHSYA